MSSCRDWASSLFSPRSRISFPGERPGAWLDEAFSHLDEESKKSMLAFVIDRVRSWGTTMLFVTHDSSEAERVAGTTLRLRRGGAA
jgi:ABC-type thiamine transport system ATPase subunit